MKEQSKQASTELRKTFLKPVRGEKKIMYQDVCSGYVVNDRTLFCSSRPTMTVCVE